jgi:hypothetical protein
MFRLGRRVTAVGDGDVEVVYVDVALIRVAVRGDWRLGDQPGRGKYAVGERNRVRHGGAGHEGDVEAGFFSNASRTAARSGVSPGST